MGRVRSVQHVRSQPSSPARARAHALPNRGSMPPKADWSRLPATQSTAHLSLRVIAIVEYLNRIDETLEPFAGRFVVHGGVVELGYFFRARDRGFEPLTYGSGVGVQLTAAVACGRFLR